MEGRRWRKEKRREGVRVRDMLERTSLLSSKASLLRASSSAFPHPHECTYPSWKLAPTKAEFSMFTLPSARPSKAPLMALLENMESPNMITRALARAGSRKRVVARRRRNMACLFGCRWWCWLGEAVLVVRVSGGRRKGIAVKRRRNMHGLFVE